MLLETEGVDLLLTDAAVHEVARLAEEINRTTENIGARRLAGVLETCLEQISFSAPELANQVRARRVPQGVVLHYGMMCTTDHLRVVKLQPLTVQFRYLSVKSQSCSVRESCSTS